MRRLRSAPERITMTEADRIRALRDEGRIDDVQARRLLNALGVPDVDAALRGEPVDEAAGSAVPSAADASAGGGDAATNTTTTTTDGRPSDAASDRPSDRPSDSATDASDRPTATGQLPDVRRWARVELFACELDVVVEAGLDAPIAETKDDEVGVDATEDGWRVGQRDGQRDRAEGSWLERLIDGVHQGRVKLRLPEATGVHLDVKAGDVDLDGVPALRGRLMAGDLDARGLRAVDVAVSAGDVDLALDPAEGAHRVRLSVGDLSIRLPAHANVEVEGHVSIGDASATAPFVTKRTGMVAQIVQGTMGRGRATLRADVGTGDLSIVSDSHGR